MSRRSPIPSWSFLDAFSLSGVPRERAPSWAGADALVELAIEAAGGHHEQRQLELLAWNERLSAIGGDPTSRDWSRFRPLRLSREEDWSDWLAHLIESSTDGWLARELRGSVARARHVHREVSTSDGYRADIVIVWDDGHFSHVEVKVGDLALEKTFATAAALRRHFPEACGWGDHILVPDEHLAIWDQTATRASGDAVRALTWTDIVVALRTAIWSGRERTDWRVWAASMTGAIEQTLLGVQRPSVDAAHATLAERLSARAHLTILNKARST